MRPRGISFRNVYNFRDLGGYPTSDERSVAPGRLFRADDLSRLCDADHETFAALGIRTVVDLRRPNEVEEDGRIPPLHAFAYHHVHFVHPTWHRPPSFASTDERTEYLLDRYAEMSIHGAQSIGEALRLIADADRAPLVFHCIAGKDRTGVIAALTLSLLGVADDIIADDYAMSELAEPLAWEYFSQFEPDLPKRWRMYRVCPPEAMLGFLAHLRSSHGSVARYAESIGVSAEHVEAMRAHLLTGAPVTGAPVTGAPVTGAPGEPPTDPAQDPGDHELTVIQQGRS